MDEFCETSVYCSAGVDEGLLRKLRCPTCDGPMSDHAWCAYPDEGVVYANVKHRFADPWAVLTEMVQVHP